MEWNEWFLYIKGNLIIHFWLLVGFVVIVFYHQIRFKDGKAYLKSVGKAFMAIFPLLWNIVKTIFNPYEVTEKTE